MTRWKGELIAAPWPLSPKSDEPGDRELAYFITGHLVRAPVVLLDAVRDPYGPVIPRELVPGPPEVWDPEDFLPGFAEDLDLKALTPRNRSEAPFTHLAIESLLSRYRRTNVISLGDVVPPEWLQAAETSFPELSIVSESNLGHLSSKLTILYPPASEFRPTRLLLSCPPNFSAGATPVHRVRDLTAGPEYGFHEPPVWFAPITVTPFDQDGKTLGGQLRLDLWRYFIESTSPQELHEQLGIADTFCLRHSREDDDFATTQLRRRFGWPLAAHSPKKPYCDGNCVTEAASMKAWIEGEDWRRPWGFGIASDYTAGIQEVDVFDSSVYEVIQARGVSGSSPEGRFRRIFTHLDTHYGILPEELAATDPVGKVSEAFNDSRFVEKVRIRRKIRRYWGYLPLMWDQLRSSIEEEHFPAHCARCGGWMTKTNPTKTMHSREEDHDCRQGQNRERQQKSRAGKVR